MRQTGVKSIIIYIKGHGDKQYLQDDIDKLIMWSEKWQIVTNYQVKQFEQVKEKEVIREIRNIWKRSKNKLKTESKDSILCTSKSYMGTQTNEYPFSEDIIILLPSKRATQAFPS